jgi:hypothetical protein
VYHPLYGPEGLVIFDHPYNAEYLVVSGSCWDGRCTSRSSSSLRRRLLLIGGLTSPVLAAG